MRKGRDDRFSELPCTANKLKFFSFMESQQLGKLILYNLLLFPFISVLSEI